MATSQETIIYFLDQLTELGSRVRTRKMFGEYAMYCDEKVVGLICDDQLFIKITPESLSYVGKDHNEGSPYPGAKPYLLIGGDIIENKEAFSNLIVQVADSLPLPKPKAR